MIVARHFSGGNCVVRSLRPGGTLEYSTVQASLRDAKKALATFPPSKLGGYYQAPLRGACCGAPVTVGGDKFDCRKQLSTGLDVYVD